MKIANPIYDVIFKYLMEDIESAKSIISAIIGKEIIELISIPQESTFIAEKEKLSVIRVDYTAIIRTKNGSTQKILIEMQKAKVLHDIARFRRYLSENYSKLDYIDGQEMQLPITCIYFLGYSTDVVVPILSNTVDFKDVLTGDRVEKMDSFMELLTHNTYLIYIQNLSIEVRKHSMFSLLTIFDQQYLRQGQETFYLESDEFDGIVEPKLKHLIMRLQQATLEKNLLDKAKMEEDFYKDFNRAVDKYKLEAAEERRQKEEEQKQKEIYKLMVEEAKEKIAALEKELAKKNIS
jgi:hypothetical protein